MKIEETVPAERSFTLTVSEEELKLILRGLFKDSTNSDENGPLYVEMSNAAEALGIDGRY